MVEQIRHRLLHSLLGPREIVVVCSPLRSQVNLAAIVRTASCCGITRVIACGNGNVKKKIARVESPELMVEVHRTLLPVLRNLRSEGYTLIGLEQTADSENLHTFRFPRRIALVVGNERLGINAELLQLLDRCVEIPVWGLPHSYNVATATGMALYEYCRQYS